MLHKPLYIVFVDLEKTFDRVPKDVIWRMIQRPSFATGTGRDKQVCTSRSVGEIRGSSGSVLSPLLVIIIFESLFREFCTGSPWEMTGAYGRVTDGTAR